MKISVIIPAYNEEKDIGKCLESLRSQTRKDFEIVLVDDGSTDKTAVVLSEFRAGDSRFMVLRGRHGGAGAARNLGAKNASGGILVFADADMTFDKNFLEELVRPIEKGTAKGTFSKEEYVANRENIWAECWNANEGWEAGRRHPKYYPDVQPVFRAILKSEFDRVGGFTPGGYDDDWSLSKKLGYDAKSAPGAVFYHKNPDSLVEVFKQAKWTGKRKYKLGCVGILIALLRASLPVSLVIGVLKSVWLFGKMHRFMGGFLVFKIVYDFGVFIGIFEMLLFDKRAK